MTGKWSAYPQLVLLALLAVLTLALYELPGSLFGRVLWVMDAGLFLLWQPLVNAQRALRPWQAALVLGAVAWIVFRLDWGILAAWTLFIAALLGGKVVAARGRREGWFLLLAFATVSVLLFGWIFPAWLGLAIPGLAPPANWVKGLALALLVISALVMPWEEMARSRNAFDVLVSVLILLVLSFVLLLTSGLMVLYRMDHFGALVTALLTLGGGLLLLSWLWDPRLGFSGFRAMLSRYFLRLGFPFEEWLRGVTEAFDACDDSDTFLSHAADSFAELPSVAGGEVRVAGRLLHHFGQPERHSVDLVYGEVTVRLAAAYPWSGVLLWQANMLLKIVADFYRAKQREHQLRQMQYLQAIHETGSRVTHDVKNLLQSIDGLCYAIGQQGGATPEEVAALVRRQLPVMGQRLRMTLDKLSQPGGSATIAGGAHIELEHWWRGVQGRYATSVSYVQTGAIGKRKVLGAVLDNVLDNLVANAMVKRSIEPTLRVVVTLDGAGGAFVLRVEDNGAPVPAGVARDLFQAPVASSDGLGVGLFHAARWAQAEGFSLSLVTNRPGEVVFELASGAATETEFRELATPE